MTDRYAEIFSELKQKNESAFIPFWMIGDPDPDASFEVIDTIAEHADILELGMPFSDPLADGPTIQASVNRALEAGTTTEECFEVIKKIRKKHPKKPIGLLVYFNLALQYGLEKFFTKCQETGVDSVILPELPIEEIHMTDPNDSRSRSIIEIAKSRSVHLTFLISTNTPQNRLTEILKYASGFLYVISKPSITGAKSELSPDTIQMIQDLKQQTDIPLCVGFGISTPEQIIALTKNGADGCIVGSKLFEYREDLSALAKFCRKCQDSTQQ